MELLAKLKAAKSAAVEHFVNGNYLEAIDLFSDVVSKLELDIINSQNKNGEEILDLQVACLNNLVITSNKIGNYEKSIVFASKTIETLKLNNVKALYGRAYAYSAIGKVREAICDLEGVLKLESDNQQALELLQELLSNTISVKNLPNHDLNSIQSSGINEGSGHESSHVNYMNINSQTGVACASNNSVSGGTINGILSEKDTEEKNDTEEIDSENDNTNEGLSADYCYSFMNPTWSVAQPITTAVASEYNLETITANIGAIVNNNLYKQQKEARSTTCKALLTTGKNDYNNSTTTTTTTTSRSKTVVVTNVGNKDGNGIIEPSQSVITAIKELTLDEEEAVALVTKKRYSTSTTSNKTNTSKSVVSGRVKSSKAGSGGDSQSASSVLPPVSLVASQSIWDDLLNEEQERINLVAARLEERKKKAAVAARKTTTKTKKNSNTSYTSS